MSAMLFAKVATVALGLLGVLWEKSTRLNWAIKIVLLGLAVWGLLVSFR